MIVNDFTLFNNNLKHLMDTHNINQKKLSTLTRLSTASVNNYVKNLTVPSVQFLMELKKVFKVSVDDMLFRDLRNEKASDVKAPVGVNAKLDKFEGTYLLYFYNSSEYKGKVSAYSKSTLKYGVMSIVRSGKGNLKVFCNFIKYRDEAENLKEVLDSTEKSEKEAVHSDHSQFYVGSIELGDGQIFIYIKSNELADQCIIILNNPPSNKTYVGGLGTSNSVSRGREHMPCIQFIILSRSILKIPDGEIYNLLSLGVTDVNVEIEAEQLISLFKNLYINDMNLKENLTEFQKKKIFENSLNSILIDLIDANMFRFAKVSNKEDDDYYRIIKGEEY